MTVADDQDSPKLNTLTTSQMITAKAQAERAAVALSEALDEWREAPSTRNAQTMCERHDAFKAVRAEMYPWSA